ETLALTLSNEGRNADAIDAQARALALNERTFGPRATQVGISLGVLGDVLLAAYRLPEALERYRRARQIFVDALGETHSHVANIDSNACQAHFLNAQYAAAFERCKLALQTEETRFDRDNVRIALYASNHGAVLARLGRLQEALPLHRRALQAMGTV